MIISQDPGRRAKVKASVLMNNLSGTTMSSRGFKLPTPVGKAVKKLSKFLETKPQPPNNVPYTMPSQFSAVPIDIAEEILLYLPAQDILRMKQVCWDVGGVNIPPGGD